MNFELSEDQRAFVAAVEKLVERHLATPAVPERFQHPPELERALEDAGFFEALRIEELGGVAAAAMVMELARLPTCAETAVSALVAPLACPEWPRPYALLGARDDAPVRFLPLARTVLRVRAGALQAAKLTPADVQAVESIYAYPMGVLRSPQALAWETLHGITAARAQDLARLGIAAEIAGCLAAGLRSVLEHVKDRRQFGRAIGSFQAVQHRLAEAATVVQAAKWLTLKAADSGTPLDAATASGYAQDVARKVSYDLHQFMGAMGLTLEHPLHRWTYRVKLLRAELGGAERQLAAAAREAWHKGA